MRAGGQPRRARETERRQARASRSLAETLQRSLLTDPPQPEHLDIAVRYRPAAREAQIGGDWYDAFVSPTGDTTLVVGDVTGHDWTAAAIAGQLRSMLRGVESALGHRAPHEVLGGLDRALVESGIATLATAIVARVEESTAEAPATPGCCTGPTPGIHPRCSSPPTARLTLLERPADLLLGVDPDRQRHHHAVALRPGTPSSCFHRRADRAPGRDPRRRPGLAARRRARPRPAPGGRAVRRDPRPPGARPHRRHRAARPPRPRGRPAVGGEATAGLRSLPP